MKRSKYGNVKIEIDGLLFHSKAEGSRYQDLVLMQKAGLIKGLVMQVKYELIPKQQRDDGKAERSCEYIADFVYLDRDKNLVVEDVKGGKSTPDFIIKRKLMLEKYGLTIKEIRK